TAINKDDVVTADADNLLIPFAGAFTGASAPGLTETILVRSSARSQLVDASMASLAGAQIASTFSATGTQYPVAIRLTGKFRTAFPEGKPKNAPDNQPAPKPEEKPAEAGLKEGTQPASVVLIGDADMIQDPVAIRELQAMGQRLIMPINSNLSFAQGLVEQLAGDSNLIAVRSRASRERPFIVVQKLQADAETNYRSKIHQLEQALADTQRKVNELQKSKEGGQRFILSPEQQNELANFRKAEAQTKTQLKQTRKQLRLDIDSLETRIKWLNIALMPVVVAIAGFVLAVMRRRRTAS
ncbi:MAG TPA: hypothetical protein VJ719_07305, partial [Chthoniobacterales bacterium]|nr:hypothetical protein [Chthoniobacterales bacterium]